MTLIAFGSQDSSDQFWVGANNQLEEMKYRWTWLNQVGVQNEVWAPGYPGWRYYLLCMILYGPSDYQAIDRHCGYSYKFICRKGHTPGNFYPLTNYKMPYLCMILFYIVYTAYVPDIFFVHCNDFVKLILSFSIDIYHE